MRFKILANNLNPFVERFEIQLWDLIWNLPITASQCQKPVNYSVNHLNKFANLLNSMAIATCFELQTFWLIINFFFPHYLQSGSSCNIFHFTIHTSSHLSLALFLRTRPTSIICFISTTHWRDITSILQQQQRQIYDNSTNTDSWNQKS